MNKRKKAGSVIKLAILTLLVVFGIVLGSTNLVGGEVKKVISECLSHFTAGGTVALTLPRILAAIFALILCVWIAEILDWIFSFFGRYGSRLRTASSLLGNLIKVVAVIFGFIWALSILGIDVTAAVAGVGIFALVLSFGAQSLVEDVVTGIFIMFEGRINIGDIVVLDDFRGVITSIGARTTVIVDAGGNCKIVNNSDIRNIQNRSEKDSLAICDVSISYDTYIPKAEKVIEETIDRIFAEHADIILSRPEYKGVQALADSAVVLRIAAATNEENIFIVQRLLNREFKLAIDAAGIEIPFPQVVVHEGK